MYGMVLMAAMTGTGDASSFGKKDSCGCTGTVVYTSCTGCTGTTHHLFSGGCHGGLFSHKHSCTGGCMGCTGYVPPAPCCTPAPVVAPAPACCPAPVCCEPKKKFCLFAKKEKACCTAPVAWTSPCATPGPVVVPPATMPAPMPTKPVDKKPGTSD